MVIRQLVRTARHQRRAVSVGASSVGLLLVLVLTHTLTNAPAPIVHVRWQNDIAPEERSSLEDQFQLVNPSTTEANTWSYDLVDTSSHNIAALLDHDRVAGTAFLERDSATVSSNAPSGTVTTWVGDRVPLFKQPGVAQGLALVLVTVALVSGVIVLTAIPWFTLASAAGFFTRAIPILSAEALGLYRVFFALGLAVVLYELRMADWSPPGETHPEGAWLADWEWIRAIANRPDVVRWIERLTFGTIALFGLGLWSRTTYATLAGSLTLWTLVRLHHTGTHSWAVLLIAVLGLVTVRWSDGFSLDNQLRRWRHRPSQVRGPSAAYGFAVWFPGLVLGTAMTAAAFAKIYASGLDWILSGAVKYHFVTDAVRAPVDWGLWIASHHWAAVVASAGAVTVEGTLIVAAFLKPGLGRAALGAAGFMLLIGFYLFQNELWYAWWLLWICYFTPWARLWQWLSVSIRLRATRPPSPQPYALAPSQYTAAVLVCLMQLIACGFQIEWQPLFSNYPMYSNTYPSTAAFDMQSPIQTAFQFRARTAAGITDISPALDRTDLDGPLRDVMLALRSGQPFSADLRERVQWISEQYRERTGAPLGTVTLLRDELAFDWSTGHFYRNAEDVELVTLDTTTFEATQLDSVTRGPGDRVMQ